MKLLHEMTASTIYGGTLTVCGYFPFFSCFFALPDTPKWYGYHIILDNFFNLS